ncbi:MAG: 23S rRNA (adenine(2503)-C(2))-methyltransferase RlmN [Opitutales bacterium]
MVEHTKPSIYGETLETLQSKLKEAGHPAFRAGQIMQWLYKKRVVEWAEMTNLSKALRQWLDDAFTLLPSKILLDKKATDVTDKLLIEYGDRSLVETVVIRAPMIGVGQENARKTICVSSQVGCAYACKFCASGLAGFKRDLNTAEIVSQLIHASRTLEQEDPDASKDDHAAFDNIVMMGMGEPLSNYDNVVPALKILNSDWGMNFGARRITLSTSGLAPQIRQLAEEPLNLRLAISLHGATNEVRRKIMPINRKYPLEELLPAIAYFREKNGRMVTLEYILIEGVNDSVEQAEELSKIARDLHAHVNCIPYNSVDGLQWKRPSMNRQRVFVNILKRERVSVTIRREKGHDIDAACGQLRLKKEQERGNYVHVR